MTTQTFPSNWPKLLVGLSLLAALTATFMPSESPAAAQAKVPADAAASSDKADLNAAAAANPPAAAVIKKTEISNFEFWHVQCDQYVDASLGRKCIGRLPVFRQNTQQLVAVLVIVQDDSKQWLLRMVIPTSLSVVDGGSIAFDGSAGKPQTFVIETCEPAACSSSLPLDANLVKVLQNSNKVSLGWTGLDHNPVKLDFEIKGVQQALKAVMG